MLQARGFLSVAGLACLLAAVSGCATTSAGNQPRTIAVVGHGVIKVKPEVFVLNAKVSHIDKDLDAVANHVVDGARRVVEVARSFPIDAERTHTTDFRVAPHVYYHADEFKARRYVAEQGIAIYMRDLSKASELTLAVVRAGATEVSIAFRADKDRDALLQEARREAVRDARRKAQMLAGDVGERLGPALQIGSPGGEYGGSTVFGQGQAQQQTYYHGSPPGDTHNIWINPTEVEVEATVFVLFALADGKGP